MDECVEEHADGNIHDTPAMAKQIIGAAAVNLLKQRRRATPQMLYTQVLLWEKQARNSQDRTACRLALRMLSRKLN